MEHEQFEDSIDDLISILNHKSKGAGATNTFNIRENKPQPNNNHDDIAEIGSLLNSPFGRFQKKAEQSTQNLVAQPSNQLMNRVLNSTVRPVDKLQSKGDMISRNFLSKTTGHSNPKEDENKLQREERNLTAYFKLNNAIRYLVFQPLVNDVKQRPKTPPDSGYYFKFNTNAVTLIKYLLEDNGFRESHNSLNFSLLWSNGPIKNEVYQCLGYYQKVNHFPKSSEITRKDAMHRNISRMQTSFGLKNFNFIPRSFILPNELSLLQTDSEKNKGSWYIVKPQASSQGRGIFITNDLDEIIPKQNNNIIVSQYLNDPYLINGLKFDLRVYVAVTSVHPLRIYIYKEGLVRFATVPYNKDIDSYANRFIHLTNYSINKKSETYVPNDDHNVEDQESASKWTFATFKTYLESVGIDYNAIFNKIEDVVVKTILSIEGHLFSANINQVPHRHNCFELFGFDILLDSKLKPWLLEVNLSPSLACESALDLKVKGDLISDLFNLAGVVPLDQRTYHETSTFGKNQNLASYGATIPNYDKKSSSYTEMKPMENLTKEEKTVLRETNEEWERRGKFKRVFPAANVNDYKNFFENDRPFNKLLRTVVLNNIKKDIAKKQESYRPFNFTKKV